MDVHAENMALVHVEGDGTERDGGAIRNWPEELRQRLRKLGPQLDYPGALHLARRSRPASATPYE